MSNLGNTGHNTGSWKGPAKNSYRNRRAKKKDTNHLCTNWSQFSLKKGVGKQFAAG